jgi:hypothetical protein
MRRFAATIRGALSTLLLDLYPSHSAWGLSKLRTSYSGSAIRIRRSSDNVETDIGFSGVDLDTAAISSFVGSDSAFVRTIYDQEGSNHFTQTTPGNQPRIVNAGTLETDNGKPAIRFVAGSSHHMTVASSTALFNFLHDGSVLNFISVVCRAGLSSNPNALYFVVDNNALNANNNGAVLAYDDRAAVGANDALRFDVGTTTTGSVVNINSDNQWTPNEQKLISIRNDLTNATAANRSFINFNAGADINPNAATGVVNSGNAPFNLTIGRRASAAQFPLDGYIQQIVLWDSDQTANRATIEDLINDYYGIF